MSIAEYRSVCCVCYFIGKVWVNFIKAFQPTFHYLQTWNEHVESNSFGETLRHSCKDRHEPFKKTAYTLKTPNVVFLNFFFARLSKVNEMSQCTFFYLMTLTFDLWPWPIYSFTWPWCQNSSLYVCPFGWDSETDRQTDTRSQNYYIPHIRDVGYPGVISTHELLFFNKLPTTSSRPLLFFAL